MNLPNQAQETLQECPSCHREIGASLQICPYCGYLISTKTTIIVPEKPDTGKTHIQQIADLINQYEDSIILYFSEYHQNVVLKTDTNIILGRATPDVQEKPLLDLIPFGAQSKGVSRHHAEIRFIDNEYVIVDLGSTNGTFVNEIKLTPNIPVKLQNGNTIRLGQLLMFVYYSTDRTVEGDKTATEPVEIETLEPTILLSERVEISGDSPMNRLTPAYIRSTLLPYLEALFGAQDVYHSAKGNRLVKPGIVSIKMTGKFTVAVKIKDCDEMIRFLTEKVMPWRKSHADRIIMWHEHLHKDPDEDPEQLSNALVQLGRELLLFATGDLNVNHDPKLIEALMPHLRMLTLSKFDIRT